MDRRNGGMATYLTSEESPNLTESQFNEDIGYTSTQRHDLQSQFNEDIGYTSTQRELRPAAIPAVFKMNNDNYRIPVSKKLSNNSRSESIEDIFNAPTQEFAPPDDDNELEIINEVKSIKKRSNASTPNLDPPPPLQKTSISKVEIIENQPGNRKDILTPRKGTELPQKFHNQSIHLDVSDSSEYEHQQLYVTSTTPPNSSSMHLSESEHQMCSNTDVIKRRTKSRTNRRHSDSTAELSQSTNLTSEASHSSNSRARLNSGSPSECSSNNSNSLSSLLKRDSRSRSSSLPASPSLLECASHSKSRSNHDSRSRSRSISSSRSKHGSRDLSRSKHSSRSKSRAKHGSRDRSRSKHSSRSKSRAKQGSRDLSRSKHSSRSRSRTKHGSCSKPLSTHSSHSRSKSKSNHRCRCRSRVNHGSRSKSRSKHVHDRDSCHDSSSRSFNQQTAAPSRHRNQSDSTATATPNGQSPLVVPHTDVSASIFHSHKDATYMKNLFKSAEKFQEKVLYYKKTTLEIEVKEQKAIEDLNESTRKLKQIQEELANLKQKSLKYHSMDSFCENISNYVDVRGCLVNEMSPPLPPLPPTPESEKLSVPQSALSPPLSPPTPTTTSKDLPIHSQPVTGIATPRRMLPSVSTKKVKLHTLYPSNVSVSVPTPTPQPKRVEPVTLTEPQSQVANVAEGCISSKSSLSAKSSNPILPKSVLDAMENVLAANGAQKKRKKLLLDTTIAKKRRARYHLNKVLKEKTASQIDGIRKDLLLKEKNNDEPQN